MSSNFRKPAWHGSRQISPQRTRAVWYCFLSSGVNGICGVFVVKILQTPSVQSLLYLEIVYVGMPTPPNKPTPL